MWWMSNPEVAPDPLQRTDAHIMGATQRLPQDQDPQDQDSLGVRREGILTQIWPV
jgi:hypothetical protein